MRKSKLIIVALLLVGLLTGGLSAEAQSPPHVFVGEATLDGTPVPDGTVIAALVSGQASAVAETVVRDGKFTLIVEQPQGAGNAEIGFVVGGQVARQSEAWELGQLTLLTLTVSRDLPVVLAEIYPPLPERLTRGQEFLLTVKADTGFHRASAGEVQVSFDPEIFTITPKLDILPGGNPPQVDAGEGTIRLSWSYLVPTSTAVQGGELVSIPMQVQDSALSGAASLSVDVSLRGTDGRVFKLEPSRVTAEVMVVSLAADFNNDDLVDVADLAALGAAWGTNQGEPGFQANLDLDGDGSIWIGDLAILLRGYGTAG